MRKSFPILLAVLFLLAVVVYTQWPAPRSGFEEAPPAGQVVPDPPAGDVIPADRPAFGEPERQLPAVEAPEFTKRAQSDDPFPHDLPMSLYWEIVSSDIRETPPEPKRIGDEIEDGDEAYRLYVYYRWCGTTLRTAELADTQLKRAADQSLNASANELKDLGELADFVIDRYQMCAPIPPDVDCHHEAFLWLSQAVKMGHEIAQTTFYGSALETLLYRRPYNKSVYPVLAHPELIDEFKVTARFALNEAMKNGHPEAYLAMSGALLDGVVFPRDPVMAYAYARTAERSTPADSLFIYTDWIARAKQSAAQLLNAEELLAAEKAAHALRLSADG